MTIRVTGSAAIAVAERGALRKSASSPSSSPLPMVREQPLLAGDELPDLDLADVEMKASPLASSPSLKDDVARD